MATIKLPVNISIAVKSDCKHDRKMMRGIKAEMKRQGFRSMADFVRKCILYVIKHGVEV